MKKKSGANKRAFICKKWGYRFALISDKLSTYSFGGTSQ